jgi:hypothetical protein
MATAHARALTAALRAATTRPEDASTIALAKNYARLLDAAAPAARYAKAVEWLDTVRTDKNNDLVNVIMAALAEHSVASDLGPKLLACLDALGMTPAARAKLSGRTGAGVAPLPESPLDELRRKRQARGRP